MREVGFWLPSLRYLSLLSGALTPTSPALGFSNWMRYYCQCRTIILACGRLKRSSLKLKIWSLKSINFLHFLCFISLSSAKLQTFEEPVRRRPDGPYLSRIVKSITIRSSSIYCLGVVKVHGNSICENRNSVIGTSRFKGSIYGTAPAMCSTAALCFRPRGNYVCHPELIIMIERRALIILSSPSYWSASGFSIGA